jgi:hypothetical protein
MKAVRWMGPRRVQVDDLPEVRGAFNIAAEPVLDADRLSQKATGPTPVLR